MDGQRGTGQVNEHMDWITQLIAWIKSIIPAGAMAVIGGTARYLHEIQNGMRKFRWVSFALTTVVAFLVGIIVEQLLPPDTTGRGGLIAVCGLCAPNVITALIDMGNAMLEKAIKKNG